VPVPKARVAREACTMPASDLESLGNQMVPKAQSIPANEADRAILQRTECPLSSERACDLSGQSDVRSHAGALIINADDWGRNCHTTDRTLDCVLAGTVSSVSAMVFMRDSERAAAVARERDIDVGLHLNLTTAFSGPSAPTRLRDQHQRLRQHLQSHRFSPLVYHPGLTDACEYVVAAQFDEFTRIYGRKPDRIDGHHHMHLCANVLLGRLLPSGSIVRPNFSFEAGEKGFANRFYRRLVDRMLARRHHIVDYFFSLHPLEPLGRLEWVFSLACKSVIEVAAHVIKPDQYRFLREGEISRLLGDYPVASCFALRPSTSRYSVHVGSPSNMSGINGLARGAKPNTTHHICVCICTYKRPQLLRRLLGELAHQDTDGLFTYSIVIVDNDRLRSAEAVVSGFTATLPLSVGYFVEPQRGIALARNKAIENANGDFICLIDDDEFPTKRWLVTLFKTCDEYDVEGVLGPVKCHFDEEPPKWITKGKFYERPTYPTGTVVRWPDARTGNVLLRRCVLAAGERPFNPEFRAGEDQDFFRRMTDKGHEFIWCDEAVAYEVVPPARWKPLYMLRKALLRGETSLLHPASRAYEIGKSVIAVPAYTVALPVALLLGKHRFIDLLVRLCDHLGKLLVLLGINLIKEPYVND
jgi:glycosyltransferase involved in cell wall biosynthesis